MDAGMGKGFAGQLQEPPRYSCHQLQALQSSIGNHPPAQNTYQSAICELPCERDAKLDELGLHYGMEESERNGGAEYYKKLALALATDFVPGFYDVQRRGRNIPILQKLTSANDSFARNVEGKLNGRTECLRISDAR